MLTLFLVSHATSCCHLIHDTQILFHQSKLQTWFRNKLTRQLKNELVLYSLMSMMAYDDFTIQCQAETMEITTILLIAIL